MLYHIDGIALLHHLLEQHHQIVHILWVKAVSRLVDDEDLALLFKVRGYLESLQFSA